MVPPTASVLAAFGAPPVAVPLEGGEGRTHRAGDIVLKRVHDVGEARWVQQLASVIEPSDLRLAVPY